MSTSTLNPDDAPNDKKRDIGRDSEAALTGSVAPSETDAEFLQGLRLASYIEQETKAAQTYADNAASMFKKFQGGGMSNTQSFALTMAWWKPTVENMYASDEPARDSPWDDY